MVPQKKIFTVQNLTQKIKDAKALFLTNYRGLNAEQMTNLRQQVKDIGGELEVVKNRLFKLALKDSGKKEVDIDLEGPTAILWSNEDEISPLKALVKFSKSIDLPEIKLGWLGEDLLSGEQVSQLALIPSRNQLEAKLTGLISSPIYGLTYALNWNLQKLTLAIKSIAEKKAN